MKVKDADLYIEPEPAATRLYQQADEALVHINQLGTEFSSTRVLEGVDQDVNHMLVTNRAGSITVSNSRGPRFSRHPHCCQLLSSIFCVDS